MRCQQPVSLSHHVEGSHPLDPEPRQTLTDDVQTSEMLGACGLPQSLAQPE